MEQKEVEITYEKIQHIYALNLSTKITSLNLSNNLIVNMEGIRALKELRNLVLTGNLIENIDVLECN
jgi:Leucine-rich repeat (LRR) protein